MFKKILLITLALLPALIEAGSNCCGGRCCGRRASARPVKHIVRK